MINKKTVKKATKDYLKLDYTLSEIDDRISYVNQLIDSEVDEYGRNHFEQFIDNFYKANINTDKPLSDKLMACKVLEAMANYLLGSCEVRQERNEGRIKYRFYINKEEFMNRVSKEILTRDIISDAKDENAVEGNIIHFLLKKNVTNHKKDRSQKIIAKDFIGEEEVNRILREYKVILDRVAYLIKNLDETEFKRKQLTSIKKSITDDMVYTKTALRGTFGEHLKNELVESTKPCWDCFDYTNPNHIKHALRVQKDLDFSDDLSHIVLDMQIIVKQLHKQKLITDQQFKVISLVQVGYKNKDIIETVGINNSRVTHIVSSVANKIANYYKSLENKK